MAEVAIRESEKQFRTLVTLSKDSIFYIGTNQEIIYVSPAVEEMFGYLPQEITKALIPKILHPCSISKFEKFWEFFDAHQRFPETSLEMTWVRKNGELLHAHQHFTNVMNEHGEVIGFLTIVRDLTKQKNTENTLVTVAQGLSVKTGGQFFRSLVKHLSVALGVDFAFIGRFTDPEFQNVRVQAFWNGDKFIDNFEYQVTGRACDNPEHKPFWCFPEGVQRLFPYDQLMKDLCIEAYAGATLFLSTGNSLGLIGILHCQELSNLPHVESILKIFANRAASEMERGDAENEVQSAYTRLRELTRRLCAAEEAERQRLARELHDEFGQSLTGLNFDLSWLKKQVKVMPSGSANSDVLKKIGTMSATLAHTIQSMRQIATSLRPTILDDLGD